MEITDVQIRGENLRLVAWNRALRLCARMNRETEVLDFIDEITPGEVFYDLGACEGRFSLYASSRGAEVVAFEPEAKNLQAFRENIVRNDYPVSLHPVGVGAREGRAILQIGQPWAGGHQKVVAGAPRKDLDFNFVQKQEIRMVSLDQYLREQNLPQPHHMKVDIDGSELPFLKGAEGVLGRETLRRIIIEIFLSDGTGDEIISHLTNYGFAMGKQFPVEPGLYNVVFER